MAQSRNQPTDDIGPFYGLPSKVKQLFDTHRGIKTLYGELYICCFHSVAKCDMYK